MDGGIKQKMGSLVPSPSARIRGETYVWRILGDAWLEGWVVVKVGCFFFVLFWRDLKPMTMFWTSGWGRGACAADLVPVCFTMYTSCCILRSEWYRAS